MSQSKYVIADSDINRMASAVAMRIAASEGTVRFADSETRLPTQIDRLASAVGQRLAAHSGNSLDLLASAVAARIAASEGTARLASSAAHHFAATQIDSVASTVAYRLLTSD